MGKVREKREKEESLQISQHFGDETELRLKFRTATCLYGNPLLQETVDRSIVAFIWRIHAAGKKG